MESTTWCSTTRREAKWLQRRVQCECFQSFNIYGSKPAGQTPSAEEDCETVKSSGTKEDVLELRSVLQTSILRGLNVFFSAFLSWYTCLWVHKFPKKEIKVCYTHLSVFIWLGAISERLIALKWKFIMKFIWRLRCLIWVELEFRLESHFQNLCNRCDKWKLAWLSEWPQLWK